MRLKTMNSDGSITLKDYSADECGSILTERNSFVLKCERFWGEDYGGSRCSEDKDVRFEEILPERVLVKDGHFLGAVILTEYAYYNGGGETRYEETLLLAKGGSARNGFSFSNDDHSRWDYTDYCLAARPDD